MPTFPPEDAQGTVKRGRFFEAGAAVCVPDETRDVLPVASDESGSDGTGTRPKAARAPSSLDTPPPIRCLGEMIPGYVLGKEIARGGMGVVFIGRDVVLGREVAIKMMLSDGAANEVAVRRFMDEARITARLAHPCVPPIYALGTLFDGRPYLAMKLIRGRTLAAILTAREQRPVDDDGLESTAFHAPGLLQVFEQICQAVGFAHSQGFVHRDLKPANVMVGSFGEVQVMDWGLARDLNRRVRDAREAPVPHETEPGVPMAETCGRADDTERSRVGEALGTPAYMPPEQARGDWDKVDARADVFALGGILCSILTGKPPYTGRNVMELVKRAVAADLDEAFARLDSCRADPALVKLAKWCLAPNPKDRPSDAVTVTAALHAHLFDTDEQRRAAEVERTVARRGAARPLPGVRSARAPERPPQQPGERRTLVSTTVSALLSLVGLSAGERTRVGNRTPDGENGEDGAPDGPFA